MGQSIKYQTVNGWTKERMKQAIRERNNGKPAYVPGIGCSYLTSDGNCCAVGCFIPQGHKGQGANSTIAANLFVKYPDLRSLMPLSDYAMQDFQNYHDIHACEEAAFDGDLRDA